jgi:hypothetical protein
LEQNPMLIVQEPQIFNVRNFQRANEMPHVWRIFEKIASRLESLFVIIDRIDCCEGQDKMNISIGEDVLPMLAKLVELYNGKIKVIVTSADLPPLELCKKLHLRTVLINTQTPARRRTWEEDDDEEWVEYETPAQEPVELKDVLGRKFTFPFQSCATWAVSSFPLNLATIADHF